MGKKNRKGSRSKKEKGKKGKDPKATGIDPKLLAELNENLQGVFRFKNGDVYIGQYQVTANKKIIRHGKGKYFSNDNTSFCGIWENDVLTQAERITYPDESWYEGDLVEGRYMGKAQFDLPKVGNLQCTFDKRPLGLVTLTDLDGKLWQGEVNSNSVTLLPRNHFFDSEDEYFKSLLVVEKTSADFLAAAAAVDAAKAAMEAENALNAAKLAAEELIRAELAAKEAEARATHAAEVAAEFAAKVEAARRAAEEAETKADQAKEMAVAASTKADDAVAKAKSGLAN